MLWCKDNEAAYFADSQWHSYYCWYPRKIEVHGTVCWVWLRYVNRRTTDELSLWQKYPWFRDYEYILPE